MKIGIFGGTFSPIHYGHLLLAELAREQAVLDQIWFVPAATAPHKQSMQLPSDQHRLAMLELAIAGNESFVISEIELKRGGISYTVDTLVTLSESNPHDEFFLLIGSDSLNDFPTWRESGKILELSTPIVVARAGQQNLNWDSIASLVSAEKLAEIRQNLVTVTPVAFSSSEIRKRTAMGQTIRYQVPRAVEKYIQTQKLYREENI